MIKRSFKEEFAKFCKNPDRTKFRELLKENTGEYNHIDFKEEWPEKADLAKHVLGFANSNGGVLVIGIKEEINGSLSIKGIEKLSEKTDLKSKIQKYLPSELDYEIHNFEYESDSEWGAIKNKKFQVVVIDDTPQYLPFLSLSSSGGTLQKNRVYIRAKTNTEEASHEALKKIINRRLDTNISTTAEDSFKEHLKQLKLLYGFIDKYYAKAPFWMTNIDPLNMLGGTRERNPSYPEEDFEEFVVRMIKKKKVIIENSARF